MQRFDRYLLSQLRTQFGFFALVLVSVYWVNNGLSLFEQLINDGQSALVFLEFAVLILPNMILIVLPIAAFAGTVQVVNRMTRESELVVIQAMGCSPWRLARTVLVFGLLVALPLAVLNHVLVPASRVQLDERRAEIAQDITARFLSEGKFLHPAKGITFYIREITESGELRDIFLSDRRQADRRMTYTASRALLVQDAAGPKLLMFDGMAQAYTEEDKRLSTASFADFTYDIGALIDPDKIRPPKLSVLSTSALLHPTETLMQQTGESRAAFLYEGHSRSAQPLLAVAAAMIGYGALLIGGFSRFGLSRQILLAIVMMIGVNLLSNSIGDIVRRDASLWPMTYLPPLVGVAIGAAMIWISSWPGRRRRGAAR
ncbi:MAG: LPS export ABC transporter permease LptF [Rhodobacteraceae bacterium]|nr:LPS export ABC transporter permease LptF [Paracoccaceae bacterium]